MSQKPSGWVCGLSTFLPHFSTSLTIDNRCRRQQKCNPKIESPSDWVQGLAVATRSIKSQPDKHLTGRRWRNNMQFALNFQPFPAAFALWQQSGFFLPLLIHSWKFIQMKKGPINLNNPHHLFQGQWLLFVLKLFFVNELSKGIWSLHGKCIGHILDGDLKFCHHFRAAKWFVPNKIQVQTAHRMGSLVEKNITKWCYKRVRW